MAVDEKLTSLPSATLPLESVDVFYIVQQTTSTTTSGVSNKIAFVDLTDQVLASIGTGTATTFLNGTFTFAQVKDSDLSLSAITTNDVSVTKHGFAPQAPNDATKFLDGTGVFSTPPNTGTPGGSDKNVQYNNASAFGGIANNATATNKYLQQVSSGTPSFQQVSDADLSVTNITTNDVSTAAHGFAPKLSNNANTFLNGTGSYTTPGGVAGGGLILIQRQLITSGATSLTFSGLDGNADGVYKLLGRIINNNAGTSSYVMQPNSLLTNQASRSVNSANGSGTSTSLTLTGNANVPAGGVFTFEVTFWARNDPNSVAMPRFYLSRSCWFDGSNMFFEDACGRWDETVTNITSIVINGANANSVGNGSEVSIFKFAEA